MNEEELKELIAKYYDGISTEEDEKALRAYFSGRDVPEGYEAEKEIFSLFMDSAKVPEPVAGFEARIIKAVDARSGISRNRMIRRILIPVTGIAAGLLIIAGSYFFFLHKKLPEDTFSDPRIAYAETMKILMDVSTQLNHGTQSLQVVGKMDEMKVKSFKSINKSTVLVEKNLRSLGYLRNSTGKNSGSKRR